MVRPVTRRSPLTGPGALRFLALLAVTLVAPSQSTEVVGRIVDNFDARVFADADVRFRMHAGTEQHAVTDEYGFFRVRDVNPGPYVLDVSLPDGRAFTLRLLVSGTRKTQFLELDYSRAVPPGDDEDY